jgi:DNA-directed RNA polymerase subunit N (RpoN/RPB10)
LKKSTELETEYERKQKDALRNTDKDGNDSDEPKENDDEKKHRKKMKNFDPVKKGKILDELGLVKMCCRRHLLTHIDMIEII